MQTENTEPIYKIDLRDLSIWELDKIIRESSVLRKVAWQEFCTRKLQTLREHDHSFICLVFYMKFPEIRESVWRVFLKKKKTNGLIFSHLLPSIYSSVPEFRSRIANRKMNYLEIGSAGERLLCLIHTHFPKFEKKVEKELKRRFFRDSKFLSSSKFKLITIVRCSDYSQKLKMWAAEILLKEELNARDLNYIYINLPELKK